MPFRLKNREATKRVTVSGEDIVIRMAGNAELTAIIQVYAKRTGAIQQEEMGAAIKAAASCIVDIPGQKESPEDVLTLAIDPSLVWVVMNEIIAFSTVSETDEKNSGCSSTGQAAGKSTENAEAIGADITAL